MSLFVGFDTSNYTTSEALCENGVIVKNVRKLLTVPEGERGLRQSDAVFQHTVNLPKIAEIAGSYHPDAVGCSYAPRDAEGSYMPCFLAGIAAASVISSSYGIPMYRFSHQRGHLAAALYSVGRLDLLEKEFLAFHVSGGTTELLHYKDKNIEKLGGTLDISAGKAVDRVGVTLGLGFPCGAELEKLAESSSKIHSTDRICVKNCDCNLSGIENKAAQMLSSGVPAEEIAFYVIDFICRTLTKMTENALEMFPCLPVLYAGGVMSNKYISGILGERFGGLFAKPEFSCDNASGIALLTEMEYQL